MNSITVQELKKMIDNKENFQLIDVREPYEAEICAIGGELIPMGEIIHQTDKIRKDIPVVMHCRSGKRSGNVIQLLEAQFGFNNLINLEGGILAWADQIDSTLPMY